MVRPGTRAYKRIRPTTLGNYKYTDGVSYFDIANRTPADIYEYLRGPLGWDGQFEIHTVSTRRSPVGEYKSVPARECDGNAHLWFPFARLAFYENDGGGVYWGMFRTPHYDDGSEDISNDVYHRAIDRLYEQEDVQYIGRRLNWAGGVVPPDLDNRMRVLVVVGTGIEYDASWMVLRILPHHHMLWPSPNATWESIEYEHNRHTYMFVAWTIMCANRTAELPIHRPINSCPPGMARRPPEADARRLHDAYGQRLPATFDCAKNQMLRCIDQVLTADLPRVYAIICLPQLGTASTELWDIVAATSGERIEVRYIGSMRKLLISRLRWVLVWIALYHRVANERAYRPGGRGYRAARTNFLESIPKWVMCRANETVL